MSALKVNSSTKLEATWKQSYGSKWKKKQQSYGRRGILLKKR